MRSKKVAVKLPVHVIIYIDNIAVQRGVSRSDAFRYITGLQLTRNENNETMDKSNGRRGRDSEEYCM